ncbi:sortase [Streptomyces sp. NBC_01275]|uniref:sortase n=1 Tax=Streptomyces sp. NBC_01275 TaxID=2903807 RepID=UPI00225A7A37|nr:sortase [Streptomyces sp. NBC_01275]MCX4759785.1 sortase [Streptomyces sp. NBC_01275]
MRITHVGVGLGLAVGALALQIPVAVAAGDAGLTISSGKAAPGSTVTVSTRACGPDVTYGKGESEAAGQFHLFEGDRKGVLTGEFQVPEESEPGTDTVTVKCPPRIKITDSYEITAPRPNGAVDAGFGDSRDTNRQLAVGGVLLAVAGAGWMLRMRRRSPGDPT